MADSTRANAGSQISFPRRKTSGTEANGRAAQPPRRPVGRPRIPRERQRVVRVTVRFTPAEAARLERRARASGCTVAALVRRDMARPAGAERVPDSAEAVAAYRALAVEARRIGANLNQAARRLNAGAGDSATLAAVRTASTAVARLLARDGEQGP